MHDKTLKMNNDTEKRYVATFKSIWVFKGREEFFNSIIVLVQYLYAWLNFEI